MQLFSMQTCRAASRGFAFSLMDFISHFSIYSPYFWMRQLFTGDRPTSIGSLKSIATLLTSSDTGDLFAFRVQSVDTCNQENYFTSGCFLKYTGLNDLFSVLPKTAFFDLLLGASECPSVGTPVPSPHFGIAFFGDVAENLFNFGEFPV